MIVDVDCESGTCKLIDPAALTAFSVRSDGTDSEVVGRAMGTAGHAADESDHVWVSIEWLIEAAAGGDEWRGEFRWHGRLRDLEGLDERGPNPHQGPP